eukprot:m.266005 g.266005  ORF g.266005 m.266005 type:complete len:409 (+) comp64904_c0_seq1:247-1473(+)
MLELLIAAVVASSTRLKNYTTTPESFGAFGDGVANDWVPIQHAIASCTNHETCVVVFSKQYLSGPIEVNSSGVTLEITGSLFMLPHANVAWKIPTPAFIATGISGVRDIRITGTGVVGNAHPNNVTSWWDCKFTGCWRPHLIVLADALGVVIDGGLHLQNSPNHHIEVDNCTGVRVDGINISSPIASPNTDGINFYGGNDQSFTNSVVKNGDDCVSVVPIGEFTDPCVNGDPAVVSCRGGNVVVHNIMCEGGHGISIGGVRHGTVTNVSFSNMTATGGKGNTQGKYSTGGLRVKSYPNSTGSVYNINYTNILLDDVYMPLQLLGRYCPFPCKTPDGNQSVKFYDIKFFNIRGSGRQDVQGQFDCSPFAPCEGITINDVMLGEDKEGKATIQCVHATLDFNSSSPSTCS